MKRRILAAASLALASSLVLTNPSGAEPDESAIAAPQKASVTLTIDYGDGVQKRFPAIPCEKKITAFEAMVWADRHPRGIDFVYRGRGQTALLTQIDDLKNQGARKKNWVYRVNGKLADRGFGVFPLKPGDNILWKFERYQ